MQGGSAKVSTYPCHCCFIKSSQLTEFKVNDDRCNKCICKQRDRCYHWEVADSECIAVSSIFITSIVLTKLYFNLETQ